MHRPVPFSITKILMLAGLVCLASWPPFAAAQEAAKPALILERGTGILDAWQPDQGVGWITNPTLQDGAKSWDVREIFAQRLDLGQITNPSYWLKLSYLGQL
jgi:hypothetical protein